MRTHFDIDGHRAFILPPARAAQAADGKCWVWYAPTFSEKLPGPEETWMIDQLHAKGIAIAGIDVGESFGSPKGCELFQKMYVQMTERRGYSRKPVLLARSRGGLMLYNWAAGHPQSVGAIAGIYPVCNLESFPGLKTAAPAYGLTVEQLKARLKQCNPIDRLGPLAEARVPILHIHGDSDKVVPLDQNSALLAGRYRALGGPIELLVIKGGGHDMRPHWFRSQPLTDFMIAHAPGAKQDEPPNRPGQ